LKIILLHGTWRVTLRYYSEKNIQKITAAVFTPGNESPGAGAIPK
jgi:hypothetical protein